MRAGEFDRGRQVGTWRTFDRAGRMVKETDFSGGGRTPMPGTGDRGPMQRSIRSRLDPDGVHDRLGLG